MAIQDNLKFHFCVLKYFKTLNQVSFFKIRNHDCCLNFFGLLNCGSMIYDFGF